MKCKLGTCVVSVVAFVSVSACQGYVLQEPAQKSQLAKRLAPRTSEKGKSSKPWPDSQSSETRAWRHPAKVGKEARKEPGRPSSYYEYWEPVDLYIPEVYYDEEGELPQYNGNPIGFIQHNLGGIQKNNSRRTKTRLIEPKLYNELYSRHKRDANLTPPPTMNTPTNYAAEITGPSIGKTGKKTNQTRLKTKSKSSAIEKKQNMPKNATINSIKNPKIRIKKTSTKSVNLTSMEEEVEGSMFTATNKVKKTTKSSIRKTEKVSNGTRMKTKSNALGKKQRTPTKDTLSSANKPKIKKEKTPTESVYTHLVDEEVEGSKKPKPKRKMKSADIDTPAGKTKRARKVKIITHTNANLSQENKSMEAASIISTIARKTKLTKLSKKVPKMSTSQSMFHGDEKPVVLSKTRKKKITTAVKPQKLDEPTSEISPIVIKGVTGRDGVQIVGTADVGKDAEKTLKATIIDDRQIGHMEASLAEQEKIIAKLEQEGKLIDAVGDPKLPGWQDVVNSTAPRRKKADLAKSAKKKERYDVRPKAARKLDFDVPNKWILEGKEKPPKIMHDLDDDITDYVDDSEGDWAKSRITNWTEATNSTRKKGGIHEKDFKQAVPGKVVDPRDKSAKRSYRRPSDDLRNTKPRDHRPLGGSRDSRRNQMTGSITRVLKPGDNYIEVPKSDEEPDRGPYAHPRSDQRLWDDPKRKYRGEQRPSDREPVRREQTPNDRESFRRDQRPNDGRSFRGAQRPNDRVSFRGDRGSGGFQRRDQDQRSYPRRDDVRSGNSGYSSRRDERPNFRDDRTSSRNAYGRDRWQSDDRRNRETEYRTRDNNWRDSRGSGGFRGSDRREFQDSRRRDGRNRNDDRYLKDDPNRFQNRNLYKDRNQKTDSTSGGFQGTPNKISGKDSDDSPQPPTDELKKKKTKKKRSAKCKRNRINFIKKMRNL